jgi:hypothetical protein
MNVLRALALQSADPNCIVLGEQEITQYLQGSKASLQKLRAARLGPLNNTLLSGQLCRSS